MDSGIKFCQYCGGPLRESLIASVSRPVCSSCGRITYLDPKVAAVTLVYSDHKLLLVKRAIEPAYGRWSFPSGYVNRGEKIEHAVEREVLEECGLETVVDRLVGLYSKEYDPVVLAVYEVSVTGGVLHAADNETLDVGIFSTDDLPQLAFTHDRDIIDDWLHSRGATQ